MTQEEYIQAVKSAVSEAMVAAASAHASASSSSEANDERRRDEDAAARKKFLAAQAEDRAKTIELHRREVEALESIADSLATIARRA